MGIYANWRSRVVVTHFHKNRWEFESLGAHMIKLSDILKDMGFFSKDIRLRFKNGQIKVNGDPIDHDLELHVDKIIDIEDFMVELVKNPIWFLRLKFIDLETLAGSIEIKNDLTEFLKGFLIVRTSKKHVFVIKKKMKIKRKHTKRKQVV